MDVDSDLILGWTRLGVLMVCMGWAAWFDHKDRRVSNQHWIVWVKPVIFIWSLDLLIQGAHWSIWLTASAIIAYASGSVIGRPTLKDAKAGKGRDRRSTHAGHTEQNAKGTVKVVCWAKR